MEVNEEKEMSDDYFLKQLANGVAFGILVFGVFLMFIILIEKDNPPESQFKTVAKYKDCDVVRFIDPSNHYQYFLHCPK